MGALKKRKRKKKRKGRKKMLLPITKNIYIFHGKKEYFPRKKIKWWKPCKKPSDSDNSRM